MGKLIIDIQIKVNGLIKKFSTVTAINPLVIIIGAIHGKVLRLLMSIIGLILIINLIIIMEQTALQLNPYNNYTNIYVEPTFVTSEIVNSSDESTSNWMSLGVFTITKSTESITSPNMFVQLAVSKSGEIAGTYYNTTTNEVYELFGVVEQQSQRAFWKIADNPESPFVETGIYNLTQNVTSIKVYFQNGEVKDLLLISLEGQYIN